MQHKRLLLIILFVMGFGLSVIQAQTLYVLETSGVQTTYSLGNISKISFIPGNLTISQFDNSNVVYELNSLRHLSFSDSTTVDIEHEKDEYQSISIYPNPVFDELKIDLLNSEATNGTIRILGLDGRLLISQQIVNSGITSIDVSHLPGGNYLCHYSNGSVTKSVIIIKQ